MKNAPNAWRRVRSIFSNSHDCEQRKLVVRLGYDGFDGLEKDTSMPWDDSRLLQ
jgi:hypothetical protein